MFLSHPIYRSGIRLLAGLLTIGLLQAQGYRNFDLTCLAPLLEQVNSEAPTTLEVAFLRGPTRGWPIQDDLGSVDFPISTNSTEAQDFFNQATALLFGLDFKEAERSYRQALLKDPANPMIFWGLAMANEQIPGRARLFARRAVSAINNSTTEKERLWIEALARFLDVQPDGPDKLPAPTELSEEQLKERLQRRIRDIEEIVVSWPDDINAKALLLRQLTLDNYRAGKPISSHVAVDTLAESIFKAEPAHPSQHYRIFLWLEERPSMALAPAQESPLLAPGIPDSWRYAAEAWKANGLNHNAIPLLESTLRVSNEQMRKRLLMPSEIANLSSNYTSLIETLSSMGQTQKAIEWAQHLISMPRPLDSATSPGRSFYSEGKRLWVEARLGSETAGPLVSELESDPRLFPGDNSSSFERAQWLYWKAVALFLLQRSEEVSELESQIAALSERAESAASQTAIGRFAEGLEVWNDLLTGDLAVAPSSPPPNVPHWLWAKELSRMGYPNGGLELARETYEARPGQWLSAATFCELSFAAGEIVPAMLAFSRQFRTDASRVDPGLPVQERLSALAEHMKLSRRWTVASSRTDSLPIPEDPESLGPLHWKPTKAPSFSLPDHSGKVHSLKSFQGEPILMQFVLGVACPFCTKQLEAFKAHGKAYDEAGIRTVIITTDPTGTLSQLFGSEAEKTPEMEARYPYPVLADPGMDTFRSYGAYDDFEEGGMHGTFLIGPGGDILWSHVSHSTFEDARALLDEAKRLLASSGN